MPYSKSTNNSEVRNIKYLNKDFLSYKNSLIEFTKTYYPETFKDFSEGSPGMMFMEMAAYIGDVLSYYTDTQLQETFLDTVQERSNLFHLAYTLGYKPKVTAASITDLELYQLIPAIEVTSQNWEPDWNYALTINKPSSFSTEEGTSFYLTNPLDFQYSSSASPTDINIYSLDSKNNPQYFLLKKQQQAISAETLTKTFTVAEGQRFLEFEIIDNNIISVESCKDSEGNIWYEVPYLAQDTIFDESPNVRGNSPTLFDHQYETPYLLKIKKVPRRFTTRFTKDNKLMIQFGAGSSDIIDEEVLPNPDNIGLGNKDGRSKLDQAFDPSNFLLTKTYGQVPTNTSLTITYLKGGGIRSNVASNQITLPTNLSISNKPNLNPKILTFCKESIAANNPDPSQGGGLGDSSEDIKQNTISNFSSQQRVVTKEDYLVRSLSLPPRFGSIAKVYMTKDASLISPSQYERVNPLASNLYLLGYNSTSKLTNVNTATKTNLITYLNEFKTLTDSINIKDAFVINFNLDFEILTFNNSNDEEILLQCITELKKFFKTDKWQINQPIIESEIHGIILSTVGVQSVVNLTFANKAGEDSGYSKYKYDFEQATKDGVIYPSLDPSIFELKYPNTDIRGKIKQH